MNLCVLMISAAAMLAQDRPGQTDDLPSLDARWRELLALDNRKGIVRWRGGSAYYLRDRLERILSPLEAAGSP